MISRTRRSFWRAYAQLDPRVKLAARQAYQLFAINPDHPSLRFKKLQGYANVWSVRINDKFRAVGERDGDMNRVGVDRITQRVRQQIRLTPSRGRPRPADGLATHVRGDSV